MLSKHHQKYRAVASQIHVKGVHMSLIMSIDCSEHGLFCFAGVLCRSMELVAIYLGDQEILQRYFRVQCKESGKKKPPTGVRVMIDVVFVCSMGAVTHQVARSCVAPL